jgi:hypothetical protein
LTIQAGVRLGPYEILAPVGAGGMGEVWRAKDTRLEREVAVKVLPEGLAENEQFRARFEREAKAISKLSHPHVCTLFDVGQEGDLHFLVMEMLEGESLADRLKKGALPLDQVLKLGQQIASALDAAHRQGIVHRDLKPGNVMLTKSGAKLLDFGLARTASEGQAPLGGLSALATEAKPLTTEGTILGTFQYMAPEQLEGQEADARTDIFALGAVLYEMATGRRAFVGGSKTSLIAAIVSQQPAPISSVVAVAPPSLDHAVRKCLEKDPDDRWQSARDVASELLWISQAGSQAGVATSISVRRKARERLAWLGVLVLVAAGAAFATKGLRKSETRDVGLPHDAPMQMGTAFRNFSVARDGSFVVYEARSGATTQLWYRRLDGQETRPIPGTEGARGTPRISPNGRRVAFSSALELKIANIAGGPVATVGRAPLPHGGGWLEDGQVFYSDEEGRVLRWVDPESGPGRQVDVEYCIEAQLIGDGQRVLCGGGDVKFATARHLDRPADVLYWRSSGRTDGSNAALLRGSAFRIIDGRYMVYMSIDGTLMGTRIESLDALTVGRPVSLVPKVGRSSYSGSGQYDIADDGTLVFAPGPNAEIARLVRVARDGRIEPLPVEEAAHLRYAPSPDGRRLASVVEGLQQQELRIYDLRGGTHETLDKALRIGEPAWSPDASRLVYPKMEAPEKETLYLRRLDSSEEPRELASGLERGSRPSTFLADDFLLIGGDSRTSQVMVMDPTATPPTIDSLNLSTRFVSISPDRRWIAYSANVGSGEYAGILLQPWPALDRRYLVAPSGNEPRWASPTELVYWIAAPARQGASGGTPFYRVTIDPTADPPVTKRELIVREPRFADTPGWSHAVWPGGDLVYLQSPADDLGHYLRVVPGWVDQMKRAVDEANR